MNVCASCDWRTVQQGDGAFRAYLRDGSFAWGTRLSSAGKRVMVVRFCLDGRVEERDVPGTESRLVRMLRRARRRLRPVAP